MWCHLLLFLPLALISQSTDSLLGARYVAGAQERQAEYVSNVCVHAPKRFAWGACCLVMYPHAPAVVVYLCPFLLAVTDPLPLLLHTPQLAPAHGWLPAGCLAHTLACTLPPQQTLQRVQGSFQHRAARSAQEHAPRLHEVRCQLIYKLH